MSRSIQFPVIGRDSTAPHTIARVLFDTRLSALLDVGDEAAIWEHYGETWCIMATDLAGFSRGVAELGIVHYLRIIQESTRLLVPLVERHGGRLLKVEGDSLFVIFARPDEGVRAAIEMQRAARAWNVDKQERERVLVGIGLGYGRVIRVAEADVYGNEVNSACVLGETFARGYEILVTKAVREQIAGYELVPIDTVPPGAGAAFRLVVE
jgi:class 3 adenylate cyclase